MIRISRPLILFFSVILLMATGLLYEHCDDSAPKKSPSLASRIELAAGNVMILPPGGKWSQGISGLVLRHGSTVRVGSGDRALIRLDDGSGVFLRQGTEVILDPLGLRLMTGEVWIEAPTRDKEPAQYRTGEISISASDAGLDVKQANNVVEIYVARGLAVVTSPTGRAEINAGEKAIITGRTAPKTSPVAFWEDWTGGMADRRLASGIGGMGAGRLYAINRNRPGVPPQELEIRTQSVEVTIRDGVARTTVEQRFFNPSSTPLEGYYWFTIPEGAAVDRFSLEVNNVLVDGEIVERQQAHGAYENAIQQSFDPALLEWIDGRTFRARIYPIPPVNDRRVILSYIELLPALDGRTHYIYPMGRESVSIQEFSLEVDLGQEGTKMALATTADARIEKKGERVTMRRSGFKPQGDFLLEMVSAKPEPLRAFRIPGKSGEADYVMIRYSPDVQWEAVKKVPGNVAVVVDTSASGNDGGRQLRTDVAEAILRALSTSDYFTLIAVDLVPRVLYPERGLAPANEKNIGQALDKLSSVRSGGATDMGGLFAAALERLHGATQPAVVYIGDGQPTVGELDGDALAERVTRAMAGSNARLFTIAVGSEANFGLLERMGRIGGGNTFRVDVSEQTVQEALRCVGQVKTATITNLHLELGAGLDQVFSSAAGKLSRGQEIAIWARTHHELPDTIRVTGDLGGSPFEKSYDLSVDSGPEYSYVPTLWARQYLTSLMGADLHKNRGTILRLGLDYGLMTPFTSFLVLENEVAYQRNGIQRRPRDPLWGMVPQASSESLVAAPLALWGCSNSEPESQPRRRAEPSVRLRKELVASGSTSPQQNTYASAPSTVAPPPKPSLWSKSAGSGGHENRKMRSIESAEQLAKVYRGKGMDAIGGVNEAGWQGKRTKDESDAIDGSAVDKEVDHQDQDAIAVNKIASICSDASRRSLLHRRAIWLQQLDQGSSLAEWIEVFRRAERQCELPYLRDRQELLNLIQLRVSSPAEINGLLSAIKDTKSQNFLRRQLLRRAVSSSLVSAVMSADAINWEMIDATLEKVKDPQARINELRRICEQNPTSAPCTIRLIRALIDTHQVGEALSLATKLREEGKTSPAIMQQIGDLLVEIGKRQDATRAYSEIVEFSAHDPAARQLLGDIYLRHGWFDLAYRQYKTLCEMRAGEPFSLLRLAAAAAGAGRVDEALRLERKVATGEGDPGPSDPRRWARLWSASRIARLMVTAQKEQSKRLSIERNLQRLQLQNAPGLLLLLTWEDLEEHLAINIPNAHFSEKVDAGATGLYALSLPPMPSTTSIQAVINRLANNHTSSYRPRPLKFHLAVIAWDGQHLRANSQDGEIKEAIQNLTIPLPTK